MSSFALKWVAILTMFIDHIGVTLVTPYTPLYYVCRGIGRIAFPLFAFMLAEGFFYTKNVKRYLLRLAIFAVISEIPFDLMTAGQPFSWNHQNVFFTLTLALVGLYFFDEFVRRNDRALSLLTMVAVAAAAQLLCTDYGAFGVLLVFIFYRFRGERRNLIVWFALTVILYAGANAVSVYPNMRQLNMALLSLFELLSLVPLLLYHRTKGYKARFWQYFFYLFYPVHMVLLYVAQRLT